MKLISSIGGLVLLLSLFAVLPAVADDTVTTYTVKAGAFPWSDRADVWQIQSVPPALEGNGPYAQGICSNRSLTVPSGTSSILIGVSANDVAKFQTDYPTAKPTGDTMNISHSDGTGLIPYTIFKMTNPPATVQAADQSQPYSAGLILLQIGDKPGAVPGK